MMRVTESFKSMVEIGDDRLEMDHRHYRPWRSSASTDVAVNSGLSVMYRQLGLLMAALINNPRNVDYVRTISSRVYQTMVLHIRQWSELGSRVYWVEDRVSYIRDIMIAADAYLQQKLPFDTYLRDSRLQMDLCSRGGIKPPKPPGC